MSIAKTIHRALSNAGLSEGSPRNDQVHQIIHRALVAAGLVERERPPEPSAGETAREPEITPYAGGSFVPWHHVSSAGSLTYKLYVPTRHDGADMPLLVMLHGCKQDPDDFAAGTRMNELAEQHGFLVAYPQQTSRANGSNCWNWFEPAHQGRGQGEPALLAGMVADIRQQHRVPPEKVFVAGLSAGAAMAIVLGQAYPDVFAAVAAHSGLPLGVACDVASAFTAMRSAHAARTSSKQAGAAVPTIVFHGTTDKTVTPANGDAIVRDALAAHERGRSKLTRTAAQRSARGRKRSAVTQYIDEQGSVRIEQWAIESGGHAWAGGSTRGSFTDATGPDASSEIVRFFLQR